MNLWRSNLRALVVLPTIVDTSGHRHSRDMGRLEPMKQKLRLITAAAVIAAALLSPEAAMAAPIPDPASFSVGISFSCPTALECPSLHPGFLQQEDFTTPNGLLHVAGEAATSPIGPIARVRGEIVNLSSQNSFEIAEALVEYEVEVVPLGTGLGFQVNSVPVVVTANVGALASPGGGFAMAAVSVRGGLGDLFFHPSIIACANVPFCTNTPTSLSGFAGPSSLLSVTLDARGSAGTSEEVGIAEFQAFADPVVSIADGLIPGTNINYRDAFEVEVSPGITQSLGAVVVPEPATYALLGCGLVALWVARRRNACQH